MPMCGTTLSRRPPSSVYYPEAYMVTGVYGTLVESERESMKMVRDSQKWKKVEIKDAQAVSQQDRSTYQNDPDVVAGMTQGTVQQVAVRAGQ